MSTKTTETMELKTDDTAVAMTKGLPEGVSEVVAKQILPYLPYPHFPRDNIRVVVTPNEDYKLGKGEEPAMGYECTMSLVPDKKGGVQSCLKAMHESAVIGASKEEKKMVRGYSEIMSALAKAHSGGKDDTKARKISITIKFKKFSITISFEW